MKQISAALGGLLCIAASGAASAKLDTVPVKGADQGDALSAPSLLSYTFADLGYGLTEFDTEIGDIEADGFGVSGSVLLPGNVASALMVPQLAASLYVTAGYASSETERINNTTIELTDYRVGLGYRLPLSSALDVNAELDFVRQEQERSFADPSFEDADSGFRVGALGRYAVIPQVEVGGGVRYVDDGEDTYTVFQLGGLYHIARGFSAVLNASTSDGGTGSDGSTTYGLGARYNFGF